MKLVYEFEFPSDVIFQSVLAGEIYVDLHHDRLDVASDLVVFSDEATGSAYQLARRAELEPVLPVPGTAHVASGTVVKFDGAEYVVVLSGEREVVIRDEDGHVRAVPLASLVQVNDLKALESNSAPAAEPAERKLSHYSTEEITRALNRLEALKKAESTSVFNRTLSRYAAATELAQDDFSKLLALVDAVRNRGNRDARLPLLVEELAQKAIETHYNGPEKGKKKGAYAEYVTSCSDYEKEHGVSVVPMSYVTFCRRCDEFADIKKREGKRAAYQKRPIPELLDHAYPIHGVRPHEVCYIDHTIATIATVSPEGVDLGKPTFTLAIDGNTTQARAFIVTYDPPSARLVLLVLRDYVRRHGRLPRIISVDNGKEFHSKELEFFCGIYRIKLRYRGPGMPRGGAMVERALGCTEDEVLAELQGNTRQMRDPRLVTKSINPFGRAVWTLTAVWGVFEEYLFSVKPNRAHPTLGMTPKQFEEKRLKETGSREHTLVRFDENIMLMTSPHARRPFHTIDKRRGIWVDGMYHWHQKMISVRKGAKVEVRVEPWIANVIYVQIDKGWVAAIARNQRPYAGRTRRSVEVALREEQRRSKHQANKDSTSRGNLKKKQRLWTPETFDARIDAQQQEMLYLFRRLGMAEALPFTDDEQTSTAHPAPPPQIEASMKPTVEPPAEQRLEAIEDTDSSMAAATENPGSESHQSDLLEGIDGLY